MKKFYILGILSLIFILASCSSTKYDTVFIPEPPMQINFQNYQKKQLIVGNIIDERRADERKNFDPNGDPLILIPFWPYSHSEVNPFCRYTFVQSEPSKTIKNIMITDLQSSGLFENVIAESDVDAIDAFSKKKIGFANNTYFLTIILKKAVWSRYITTYGLSSLGAFVWGFGAPVSYGSVTIQAEVKLYKADELNKPLNEKVISDSVSCTEFIFDQIDYKPAISEFKIAEMIPEINRQIRKFLYDSLVK